MSAGFAPGAREGRHRTAVLEEGVGHLEDGALLSGGEPFDLVTPVYRDQISTIPQSFAPYLAGASSRS